MTVLSFSSEYEIFDDTFVGSSYRLVQGLRYQFEYFSCGRGVLVNETIMGTIYSIVPIS